MISNPPNKADGRKAHPGAGNGARSGKSGSAGGRKDKRRNELCLILKRHIGSTGFVGAFESGGQLRFRVNGEEFANMPAEDAYNGGDAARIDIAEKDYEYSTTTVGEMRRKAASGDRIDPSACQSYWVLAETGDDGERRYAPAGVFLKDGKAVPVKESTARRNVCMFAAKHFPVPQKTRVDGKRVKIVHRYKDDQGSRYIFRYNGADLAVFHRDGRFDGCGSGISFEDVLRKARVYSVPAESEKMMLKVQSALIAGGPWQGVDENAEPYDDQDECIEADRKRAIAIAVEAGGLPAGTTSADACELVFGRDLKPRLVPKIVSRDQIADIETAARHGGGAPRRRTAGGGRRRTAAPAAAASAAGQAAPAAAGQAA